MRETPHIEIEREGITLRVGTRAWDDTFFVSVSAGTAKLRKHNNYLRVTVAMSIWQADAFFTDLARAVGHDAPKRSRPISGEDDVTQVLSRDKSVDIFIRGNGETTGHSYRGVFSLSLRRARKLCEEIAPMLGWDLVDA